MKITVFTLATDDDNGTTARVFASEAERVTALLQWVGSDHTTWQESELAGDLHEYVQSLSDHMDTFSTDEHQVEIDIADVLAVNQAWAFCKDGPGAFGNLYDPTEVMTILDGWSEQGDMSDTSNWFNPDDPNDCAAILAWCEKEGPGFEDEISNLVCSNLPNRKEAFDALAEKRSKPSVPIIL